VVIEELLDEATEDDEDDDDEVIGALEELEDDTVVDPEDEIVELFATGDGETYTVDSKTVVELAREELEVLLLDDEELDTTGLKV
jgi:hypothetical protein